MCDLYYLGGMKQWKTIALTLFCATLCSSFSPTHEYYVSVGEMSLNTESGQLEFAIRIFSDDLETALEGEGHPGVDVLNDATAPTLVADYVLDQFQLWTDEGSEMKLFFLGMEGDEDAVFVYLETQTKNDLPDEVQLRHAILMDHFPSQVNILHYSNPDNPSSYRFSEDDDVDQIEL